MEDKEPPDRGSLEEYPLPAKANTSKRRAASSPKDQPLVKTPKKDTYSKSKVNNKDGTMDDQHLSFEEDSQEIEEFTSEETSEEGKIRNKDLKVIKLNLSDSENDEAQEDRPKTSASEDGGKDDEAQVDKPENSTSNKARPEEEEKEDRKEEDKQEEEEDKDEGEEEEEEPDEEEEDEEDEDGEDEEEEEEEDEEEEEEEEGEKMEEYKGKEEEANIINLNKVDIQEWIKDPRNIYVGREHKELPASIWGNPFLMSDGFSREEVNEGYKQYLAENEELRSYVSELKGKRLGCWCSPKCCHAETLHLNAGNRPIYAGRRNDEAQEEKPKASTSNEKKKNNQGRKDEAQADKPKESTSKEKVSEAQVDKFQESTLKYNTPQTKTKEGNRQDERGRDIQEEPFIEVTHKKGKTYNTNKTNNNNKDNTPENTTSSTNEKQQGKTTINQPASQNNQQSTYSSKLQANMQKPTNTKIQQRFVGENSYIGNTQGIEAKIDRKKAAPRLTESDRMYW